MWFHSLVCPAQLLWLPPEHWVQGEVWGGFWGHRAEKPAVLALLGALTVRDRTEPCVRRLGRGWRREGEMEVEQKEGQPVGWGVGEGLCSSEYKKGSWGVGGGVEFF